MKIKNTSNSKVHLRGTTIMPGEEAVLTKEELQMSGVKALMKEKVLVKVKTEKPQKPSKPKKVEEPEEKGAPKGETKPAPEGEKK